MCLLFLSLSVCLCLSLSLALSLSLSLSFLKFFPDPSLSLYLSSVLEKTLQKHPCLHMTHPDQGDKPQKRKCDCMLLIQTRDRALACLLKIWKKFKNCLSVPTKPWQGPELPIFLRISLSLRVCGKSISVSPFSTNSAFVPDLRCIFCRFRTGRGQITMRRQVETTSPVLTKAPRFFLETPRFSSELPSMSSVLLGSYGNSVPKSLGSPRFLPFNPRFSPGSCPFPSVLPRFSPGSSVLPRFSPGSPPLLPRFLGSPPVLPRFSPILRQFCLLHRTRLRKKRENRGQQVKSAEKGLTTSIWAVAAHFSTILRVSRAEAPWIQIFRVTEGWEPNPAPFSVGLVHDAVLSLEPWAHGSRLRTASWTRPTEKGAGFGSQPSVTRKIWIQGASALRAAFHPFFSYLTIASSKHRKKFLQKNEQLFSPLSYRRI